MMLAWGAIEMRPFHVERLFHPPTLRGAFVGNDEPPVWFSTFNVGPPLTLNCCKPNWVLNVAASVMIFGSL